MTLPIHPNTINVSTVGDLRKLIANLRDDVTIIIGIDDDAFGADGGCYSDKHIEASYTPTLPADNSVLCLSFIADIHTPSEHCDYCND